MARRTSSSASICPLVNSAASLTNCADGSSPSARRLPHADATASPRWKHPLIVGAAITVTLAYIVFLANYFLFTTFLTGFVVLLLDLLGQSAHEMAGARLLGTLLGGTIALVASHVRPIRGRSSGLAEA